MDLAILTAIIAPASALLAVALTSRYQLRAAREAQAAQYHVESMKLAFAAKEKQRADVSANYITLHESLSHIAREYSLTSLSIMLNANTSNLEYSLKHLKCCERLDNARALVEMHFPDAYKSMDELYGQMSIFWWNYTEISSLITSNGSLERREIFQAEANQAAIAIGELAFKTKAKLNTMVRETLK